MSQSKHDFMVQQQIFKTLPEDALKELVEHIESEAYESGDTILKKDDPGDSMYIIRQGSVEVQVLNDNHEKVFTAYLGPGDFFGEMALLTGEKRGANVLASGDLNTECLRIAKENLEPMLREHPRIARFLTEILGKRLLEGEQLRQVGKYQLFGQIGSGGAAYVYDGIHPGLNRSVAVKMLSHELIYEGDFAQRFKNEARIIADLHHDNIVQVYDTEEAYATIFIVMEKLQGQELGDSLLKGPFSVENASRVLKQILKALEYAHSKGIIHRDIKPANIFVEDELRVKLMDFGIAGSPVRDEVDTNSKSVLGTPGYIAPEVMRNRTLDERSDIYAVGMILYEMLTGKPAFDGKTTKDIIRAQLHLECKKLPDELAEAEPVLAEIVERATAQNPDERFSNCSEILELLSGQGDVEDIRHLEAYSLNVVFPKGYEEEMKELFAEFEEELQDFEGVFVQIGKHSKTS